VPEGFGVEFSHMSRIFRREFVGTFILELTRDFETQLCVYSVLAVNLLSAKKSKSKVIVPARTSPSLITFQFHALVVSLSDMRSNVFS